MIQSGVMSATTHPKYPYTVVLHVNARTPIAYFIDNVEDIPPSLKLAMACGEKVAGVFEFEPADQFAHYVIMARILLRPMEEMIQDEDGAWMTVAEHHSLYA